MFPAPHIQGPTDLVTIEAEIGEEALPVVTVVGIVVIGGTAIVVVGTALVLTKVLVFSHYKCQLGELHLL